MSDQTPQTTTDWRSTLRTAEALDAMRAMDRLHRGECLAQHEIDGMLRWFAESGMPAMKAAMAEAEERGCSIYGL